jgi:hypothetical protein
MNVLRSLRVGLAAIATLTVLVTPAAASAHIWKVNGVEPKTKVQVEGHSTIYFQDKRNGAAMKFSCELTAKAVVGPGHPGLGEITSITNNAGKTPIVCHIVRAENPCSTSAEIQPENLPWATELTPEFEKEIYEGWTAHWKVKCTGGTGSFSEKCEGLEAPKAENLSGEVRLDFSHQWKQQVLSCESDPLALEGYEYLKIPNGESLSVA